jgi:acyl-CoA reductase-like NAD-dependent aldehyde dehydrogenase
MMGNVVVWKPSDSQVFSAQIIIEVFKEAVPDGVINVVLRARNDYRHCFGKSWFCGNPLYRIDSCL